MTPADRSTPNNWAGHFLKRKVTFVLGWSVKTGGHSDSSIVADRLHLGQYADWGRPRICRTRNTTFNSSPPSAAYMRQWTRPALFQVMARRLFGAWPLPEPMLVYYCLLDSREQISVKFESGYDHFQSRKCIRNCRLSRYRPFCPWGEELTHWCGRNFRSLIFELSNSLYQMVQ